MTSIEQIPRKNNKVAKARFRPSIRKYPLLSIGVTVKVLTQRNIYKDLSDKYCLGGHLDRRY